MEEASNNQSREGLFLALGAVLGFGFVYYLFASSPVQLPEYGQAHRPTRKQQERGRRTFQARRRL